MNARIADSDDDLRGLPVPYHSFGTSVEKRLCVLRLRTSLKDLLLVKHDGAVG